MRDWRATALCNVLHKIISKVLANHLMRILSKCILENQTAIVLECSILDNALATIELVHYMKSKTKVKVGDVALKVDISKAYDKLDWEYIRDSTMAAMDFSIQWIS